MDAGKSIVAVALSVALACALAGCLEEKPLEDPSPADVAQNDVSDAQAAEDEKPQQSADELEALRSVDAELEQQAAEAAARAEAERAQAAQEQAAAEADALLAALDVVQDFRASLSHGPKPAANQKYIVLHDTEGSGSPQSVVDWWDENGNLIAAHFVVGKDGSIVQCVPLEDIAHHAGYGDTGHNDLYGIEEDGRDDMRGSNPIGDWASDYGMNGWSVGIELVHVGGEGDYPEEQLEALDALIAYIDAYFGGNAGEIIDHKMWRTGNSDTSPEFSGYLDNYRDHRTHL